MVRHLSEKSHVISREVACKRCFYQTGKKSTNKTNYDKKVNYDCLMYRDLDKKYIITSIILMEIRFIFFFKKTFLK